MSKAARGSPRIRFGPFEFDVETRELRRDNAPVTLQDQPLRMLAILVEHAGEIVSREEFQRQLWPTGTFVEFDHSLNTAVKKLRQALGDRPELPTFIETVPRHGYRFIAGVESVQLADDSVAFTAPAAQASPRWPYLPAALLVAALVAASALTIGYLSRNRQNDAPSSLLLNLRRLTADPGLSWQPAISKDGHLVVFSSDRADEGNLDLWVMQVEGNDPVRLTNGPADELEPDFCPDGRVVFRSDSGEGGVYSVPALGGTPILLAAHGRGPKCSPDGKSVAFWTGDSYGLQSSVHIVSIEGGESARVGRQLDRGRFPLWSEDSRKLLVLGYAAKLTPWNKAHWFLVPISGGAPIEVDVRTSLAAGLDFRAGAPLPLAWIPSTHDVLFAASQGQPDYATTRASLWALNVDPNTGKVSGGVRPITTSTGRHESPSVAADGSIVFSEVNLDPGIWAAEIDSGSAAGVGKLRPVTREKYWESRPSVSADDSTMVFRTDRGGGWDFWSLDFATGRSRPITISKTQKVFAALSRDARYIAWQADSGVYSAELRTGTTRQLCANCGAQPSDWTMTGDIVVTLPASDAVGIMNHRDGAVNEILRPAATKLAGVSMSQDDRWIAFESVRDGGASSGAGRVMIAPAKVHPIPEGVQIEVAANGSLPRWSPNGQTLYFLTEADGWNCVWAARFDPKTGTVRHPASPFMHLHRRNHPLAGSYAVSSKRLFVGLHERTGNIWVGRRK